MKVKIGSIRKAWDEHNQRLCVYLSSDRRLVVALYPCCLYFGVGRIRQSDGMVTTSIWIGMLVIQWY